MEFRIYLMFLTLGGVWSEIKRGIQEDCHDLEEMETCVDFFEESVGIRNMEDDLCPMIYPMMSCLHDFVEEKFHDSDMKENYLCKMNNFWDRVKTLCRTEQNFEGESSGDGESDEEILQCLEGMERDTEECASALIPKIPNMMKEHNVQGGVSDLDSVKCLVMNSIMQCTINRLGERCPDDVVENIKEGASEVLPGILGDKCQSTINTGIDAK